MSVKKDIKAAKACDSAKTAEYQLRFGCPINEFCDHPAKTKKEMGRISALQKHTLLVDRPTLWRQFPLFSQRFGKIVFCSQHCREIVIVSFECFDDLRSSKSRLGLLVLTL